VCRNNVDKQNDTDEDALIRSDDPEHPANLIPELCRGFYSELNTSREGRKLTLALGWVTGTGGGISIRKEYVLPLLLRCS